MRRSVTLRPSHTARRTLRHGETLAPREAAPWKERSIARRIGAGREMALLVFVRVDPACAAEGVDSDQLIPVELPLDATAGDIAADLLSREVVNGTVRLEFAGEPLDAAVSLADAGVCPQSTVTALSLRFAPTGEISIGNRQSWCPEGRRPLPPTVGVWVSGAAHAGGTSLVAQGVHDKRHDPSEYVTSRDTARRSRFRSAGTTYPVLDGTTYRVRFMKGSLGSFSDCIVVIYDIRRSSTFVEAEMHLEKARERQQRPRVDQRPPCGIILAGCKADAVEDPSNPGATAREVPLTRGRDLADRYGAAFVEFSNVTGDGILRLIELAIELGLPSSKAKAERMLEARRRRQSRLAGAAPVLDDNDDDDDGEVVPSGGGGMFGRCSIS
eukprot:Hpha_TRINITY_DN16756_c1_g1::TRINITY_DN16756_c1_g1_i6::g.78906::m.78906